jgi:hypothetical protein
MRHSKLFPHPLSLDFIAAFQAVECRSEHFLLELNLQVASVKGEYLKILNIEWECIFPQSYTIMLGNAIPEMNPPELAKLKLEIDHLQERLSEIGMQHVLQYTNFPSQFQVSCSIYVYFGKFHNPLFKPWWIGSVLFRNRYSKGK